MVTPAFNSSVIVGRPTADSNVGTQSSCDMMSLKIVPDAILFGQRIIAGTRNPPSQLVFFSLRKGGDSGVRPRIEVGAIIGAVQHNGVIGYAQVHQADPASAPTRLSCPTMASLLKALSR